MANARRLYTHFGCSRVKARQRENARDVQYVYTYIHAPVLGMYICRYRGCFFGLPIFGEHRELLGLNQNQHFATRDCSSAALTLHSVYLYTTSCMFLFDKRKFSCILIPKHLFSQYRVAHATF